MLTKDEYAAVKKFLAACDLERRDHASRVPFNDCDYNAKLAIAWYSDFADRLARQEVAA